MRVKGVREVFGDYKKISLMIATSSCDFKCEHEGLCPQGSCQNSHLVKSKTIDISNDKLIEIFNKNDLVNAIVFGGLEAFLQFEEIYSFIKEFRKSNDNEVILYTGYYPEELKEEIEKLKEFSNIIVKFGRFMSESKPRYDEVLGVELASENQFAMKIS